MVNNFQKKRLFNFSLLVYCIMFFIIPSGFSQSLKKCPSVRKLSIGSSNSLVLFDDGTVYGFGWGAELPINLTGSFLLPKRAVINNDSSLFIQDISTSSKYGIIVINGEAWYWGENANDVSYSCPSCSGHPSTILSISIPTKIKIDPTGSPNNGMPPVVSIGGGAISSVLLAGQDGQLWVAGSNSFGQLGDGTSTAVLSGYKYVGSGFSFISGGYYTTGGIKFSLNGNGQNTAMWGDRRIAGIKTMPASNILDANNVTLNGNSKYMKIGAEPRFEVVYVIDNNNNLWSKGALHSGFGLGRPNGNFISGDYSMDFGMVGSFNDWVSVNIVMWGPVIHGLRGNGQLYTWGYRLSSSGVGSTSINTNHGGVGFTTPTPIASHIKFDDIASGMPGQHFGAVSKDKVFMWGLNHAGQLGINSTVTQGLPVWANKPSGISAQVDLSEKICNRFIVDINKNDTLRWGDMVCDCSEIFAPENIAQIRVGYKSNSIATQAVSDYLELPSLPNSNTNASLTSNNVQSDISISKDMNTKGRFYIDVTNQGEYMIYIKTTDSDGSQLTVGTSNLEHIYISPQSIKVDGSNN